MMQFLSRILDQVSSFLAVRKGLLPLIGIAMILLNFVLQFFVAGWLVESNLFLHFGLIIALLGFMLAWAL